MLAGQLVTVPAVLHATVSPENAGWPLNIVLPADTDQPLCHPPVFGEAVTLMFRFSASLRVKESIDITSNAALLTR